MNLYTLTNRNGLVAKITNLGGHLTVHVPDRNGHLADIVLGHSTLEPYLDHKTNPYFGSIVGGTPTASPRASSPSTASSTRSTPAAALDSSPAARRRVTLPDPGFCARGPSHHFPLTAKPSINCPPRRRRWVAAWSASDPR